MRRWSRKPEHAVSRLKWLELGNGPGRVDFLANRMNYVDHLLPIYNAMPEENRGYFVVEEEGGRDLLSYCISRGVRPVGCGQYRLRRRNVPGYLVVGGLVNVVTWPKKRLVLINHGCGGSWNVNHQSYAGGVAEREKFTLILEPGDIPAERDKRSCPRVKVAVVGCPKMDRWYPVQRKERSSPPVVAVGFHQDTKVCPESRTALPHYMSAFPRLAEWQRSGEVKVIGTGHPEYWKVLLPIWKRYGFEPVLDFDEVMERADVYVRDQYSTIYEFASLDRPVVLLNAPWYRRDVEHGMRFWELSNVGINVNEPEELIPAVRLALTDPPEVQRARHGAVGKVYRYMDGRSTERAVSAILSIVRRKP